MAYKQSVAAARLEGLSHSAQQALFSMVEGRPVDPDAAQNVVSCLIDVIQDLDGRVQALEESSNNG